MATFSIIGSSCCQAILEIEGNCLSNLFPSNPIFAPLLNKSCGQQSKGNGQASRLTASNAAFPGLLPRNHDIQQCWSSFSVAKLASLAVIIAITLVSDHCLPKLFPFNPAFHSTLKKVCLTGSRVGGSAPSPLGSDLIILSKLYLPDYQMEIGNKTLQNASHHFQALINVLMRFMELFLGVNLVWSVLLAVNPSMLLVTNVGPKCSHSTCCSLYCSRVNVCIMLLGLHQILGEFDHAYEFGPAHH
ncbi:hypothetical protein CFP56_015219 [Quercus suber]|uniref:Prolamin-like domain-containing protein n=1 Tax=Quercus suber TaxID=58331 RepID=A0AAW0M4Z5_QUESU